MTKGHTTLEDVGTVEVTDHQRHGGWSRAAELALRAVKVDDQLHHYVVDYGRGTFTMEPDQALELAELVRKSSPTDPWAAAS